MITLNPACELVGHGNALGGRRVVYAVAIGGGCDYFTVSEPVALDVDGYPMGMRPAPYAFVRAVEGDPDAVAMVEYTPAA